jgi:putative NADH-flavin reductase
MKVALIGASGTGGSRLLAELNRRGHQVTAIARHPEKVAKHPGVTAEKGDVFDKPGLVALIKGHDAVISSVHFKRKRSEVAHRGGKGIRREALLRRRRRGQS